MARYEIVRETTSSQRHYYGERAGLSAAINYCLAVAAYSRECKVPTTFLGVRDTHTGEIVWSWPEETGEEMRGEEVSA